MSTVKVVAANTIYQIIGKIVTMAVTLLATFLITRYYGREGYGIFNLILTFPAVFYILSDFGLNAIATRDLSLDKYKFNNYLGNIYTLRSLISILLIFVGFGIVFLLPYDYVTKLGISIGFLTILTNAIYSTSNIGFQVKFRYDLSILSSSLGSIATLICIVLMIYFGSSIVWSAVAYLLASIITALFSIFFLRKLNIFPVIKLDHALAKKTLIKSLPLGIMFIFSQINFKADSIILSFSTLPSDYNLSNLEAVGIYGLAYKIFEVALIVPTFFMNSVYPIMVKRSSDSKEALYKIFKRSLAFLFFTGTLASIVGYYAAPLIITLLGGEEFTLSIDVLRILLGSIFIFFLTQPFAWLLVTVEKQKYLPGIYLISSILNVTLNLIFIPKYSYIASANITWISELAILTMLCITVLYEFKKR